MMPLITACVMFYGTHKITCVESTPPTNFNEQHTLQEMHRQHPQDTFWFVWAKPKGV